MSDILGQLMISFVGWIGCAIAFMFAYQQWRKGQKVLRAEFLERLIQKFKELDYDKYLRIVENQPDDGDDDNPQFDAKENGDGITAYDFLMFLSYVCYLKNSGIITKEEFLPFECYVKRTLKAQAVRESMQTIHVSNHMEVNEGPYFALLKYGLENNISGIHELHAKIADDLKEERIKPMHTNAININDNKTYRTHIDVLNGIFGKNLVSHMRGVSPLDENTYVWFPHIFKDKNAAGDRLWFNTISADGNEIRETCTDTSKLKTFFKQAKGPKRYVFAKMHDGSYASDYKFMGIYEFKRGEEGPNNEFCWVYERTAVSFKV